MEIQECKAALLFKAINKQGLHVSLLAGLTTICMASTAVAQSFAPSAIPAVPDARKPGRNIQPSQPSSTQPPAAQPPATPPAAQPPATPPAAQPPATPPAAQPPATPPAAPATTWSNEGLFSQSTQIAFQLQPANHPKMPSIDQLMQTSVTLYQTSSPNGMRYSGNPLANAASVKLTLAELAATKGSLTDSARVVIQKAVVATVNAGGVNGVACIMDAAPTADTPNTVNVVVAQVGSVRTVTSGVRTESKEESVNDTRQTTIKEESPIQEGDLLEKTVLDDYLYSLSRFPGRTVSAAVTSEPSSAQVVLDYYVQEKNVFDVFTSVSNTGTEQTSYWQQRVGILATQLSNNDDILAVEYQTASFTQTQSVSGYYDARVGTMKNLRWRVTGNWGNYNSSDVGLAGEDFNGSNWGFQGDLIWTFYQKQNFFLDFDGSGRVWNSYTDNEPFQTTGDANFVTVSGTLNALAVGDTWAIQGSLGASYTATNADQESLDNLGRTDTSPNWTTINGSVYGSIYLDPWFDSAWGKNSGMYKPLVHELFGSLRGQYAFDYRLTPLSQYTLGGLYTVRGFATSINAGDSALVGTVEYRMHLPRMFAATTPTSKFPFVDRPFRWAPDSSNGASPDWDLVLSTFFDGGTISNSNAFEFEVNTPMYSAGVGLDLSILDNVSIGVDWAWALNSIDQLDVQSGSSQFWFSASFVY